MAEKEKKQSIGALWVKTVGEKKFLSGSLEVDGKTVRISIWKNDYKKEDKHPDYKIFLDTWEPKAGGEKESGSEKPKSAPKAKQVEDDDDIPF